jgi:pyruvate formate lyase activating enzyme
MPIQDYLSTAREAKFYRRGKKRSVTCTLCVKNCTIEPGKTGFCGVRYNDGGKLMSLSYGRIAAIHIAPSEIKPFYHFYPGALWLSLGTMGCNLKCPGCQNWYLAHSQADPGFLSTEIMSPERVVEIAQSALCAGLSFTYNEPTVWLEFTLDAARAAARKNLLSTYVSNGMMGKKALQALLKVVDAFRFDVKGFSKKAYEATAGPCDWEQVKRNAELVAKKQIHLEIVTNITPGKNDDTGELAELAAWIKSELGPQVPWHITRFHPSHKFEEIPPTPLETLEKIHEIGKKAGLEFVYIGNVFGHPAESTYCPQCGNVLIRRQGILITDIALEGGKCANCGRQIPIIGPPEAANGTQAQED